MLGFQAEGAAPLVTGRRVEHPETVASAIRIGNPARWEEAMAAMTASAGRIDAVSDARDPRRLPPAGRPRGRVLRARERGVGGRAAQARRRATPGAIACVLTGHGLKDPQTALEQAGAVVPCEPGLAAVERAVLG